MEENTKRIEELEGKIADYKEEMKIWQNRDTDAAIVERNNLLSSIARLEREFKYVS